jgi:3-hydroxybutyryl-CoA dehydratase
MSHPLLINPGVETRLIGVSKHLSQFKIDRFAVVSGGVGALHVDPEYGKSTIYRSTIAHGYLILGYICEMLKNNFGRSWLISGTMDVKLVGPARSGDTILTGGHIIEVKNETERKNIVCNVWADNHVGDKIVVGQAEFTQENCC